MSSTESDSRANRVRLTTFRWMALDPTRSRVSVIGRNGGYIFGPNTFTLDTPLENILAPYEVATGKPLM